MKTIFVVLVLMTIIWNAINCSKERLIEDNIDGLIAGFGDFDSDKLPDVFIMTDEGKSLELLKGHLTEPVLRKWTSVKKCSFSGTDETIVGVIPADFSGRALMDVLVITSNKSSDKKFNIWHMRGNGSQLDCVYNASKPLVSGAKSHPFVVDYNGDMIADFIVQTDACVRQL
jgi:integrin alpha FG-GAP repeat containing protein 1